MTSEPDAQQLHERAFLRDISRLRPFALVEAVAASTSRRRYVQRAPVLVETALIAVHRLVCIEQRPIDLARSRRPLRADSHLARRNFVERFLQPPHKRPKACFVGIHDRGHELVAAHTVQPRNLSENALHRLSACLQQMVAFSMAAAIVDLLHTVDIEKNRAERARQLLKAPHVLVVAVSIV